jgi:cardiolipin synthase
MQALLDAVVDLVALVSPTRVRAIADRLRGLAGAADAPSPRVLADTPAAREAVARVLAAWSGHPRPGDEVAGMLLGATEARRRIEDESNVEFVWTGPTTRFVPTRRTEQVLLDLIGGVQHDLFLVSFVAYDVPSVAVALNEAAARGVSLMALFEAPKWRGGTLDYDPAAKMQALVPAMVTFNWKDRAESFVDGKVHAKVAVADAGRAFITSANLTGAALERNMEAGVLFHGGSVPRTLRDHLQALIDVGIIRHVD